LLFLALAMGGCAGHAARTEGARTALDEGIPNQALELLDEQLEVKGPSELPEKTSGDNALLLLDRAMVLQQLASTGKEASAKTYALSSRDLEIADKQVEVLDLSRSAVDDIGKYLFSDATGPYKAPTYEKLMINTMNMVNYLARGDLNGAKVEARRLAVMQRFIDEHEGRGASLSGPGSYLAGFAFEKSGDASEALHYYDEALEYGSFPSLSEPVARLSQKASYRSPRITQILRDAGESKRTGADEEPAELLVVMGLGRVPAKIAKRIPIGLALTFVSGALSPTDVDKANYLAAQGLVTWVNYPELGEPRGEYGTPGFALDGAWQELEGALAIDQEAKHAWDDAKGTVVASAITRLIARVATGEIVRQSTGGGVVGALLSLGTQATLTAVDTPDTRSWSTLPARIAIGRVRLTPGTHYIDLQERGVRRRRTVTLQPGGWAVLNMTVLR
jgi:hypothetical protein